MFQYERYQDTYIWNETRCNYQDHRERNGGQKHDLECICVSVLRSRSHGSDDSVRDIGTVEKSLVGRAVKRSVKESSGRPAPTAAGGAPLPMYVVALLVRIVT